jgi:hypothetical protein
MTDATFFEIVSIVFAILGGIGTVALHIYGRIAEVENRLRAEAQVMEAALDKKIELDRETNRLHREGIIDRVASLPTKEDFQKMEERLTRAIQTSRRT